MLDLRKLRYFVQIADAGSFSKAATRLSVAQPALSRHIGCLEEALGTKVFHRNGRGVTLTATGEICYAYATGVIARTGELLGEIERLGREPTGRVTLGLTPTLSAIMLTHLIAEIADRHPGIRLHVREGFSATVAEWLQTGQVDLAVVYGLQHLPAINADTLLVEDLHLVTAPGAAPGEAIVPGARLQTIPLVLPGRPHGLRQLVESEMARAGYGIEVRFEIDSMPTMIDLAAKGVCATVLPKAAVRKQVEAGLVAVRPIEAPTIMRTMRLATASNQPVNEAMRVVVKTIQRIAVSLRVDRSYAP